MANLLSTYPLVAVAAAIANAALYLWTVLILTKQSRHAQKTENGRMFLQISEKWSDIYNERNSILNTYPITGYTDIFREYRADARRFLKEEKWRNLRKVCNFFETLGLLLEERYIDEESLFTLVSIDIFSELKDTESVDVPEGVMYRVLKGPIEYLRKHYRADIYKYYDHPTLGVLPKYKKYVLSPGNQTPSSLYDGN